LATASGENAVSIGSETYDVIVVGCGIAGLSAAVSAQQAGAKVALLERAPKEDRGGNTRYTESFWRMKNHDEVSEDFEDCFGANAGGHLDPEIIKDSVRPYEQWPRLLRSLGFVDPEMVGTLVDNAGPTLRWLTGFGVTFDFLPNYFITQSTTRIAPVGGGLALVEALATHAETVPGDIAIHYDTTARRLLQDDEGRVIGLEAVGARNRTVALKAPAVVLASGGFEGNPEMLSHYVGPQSQFIRPVAKGGYFNRGEGIRMALDIGASPCGDYGSFHAQPVDPRSGQHEPVVLNYPYGILVNRGGRRFIDEAPATVDASYEAASRQMLAQQEGIAFAITDARLEDVPNWRKSVRTDQPPVEAETVAGLAGPLGIDGEQLVRTVDAYNKACGSEDSFLPLELDGLATDGLSPCKSNWARPIDRAPFRAWPIIAANCFTFGGLKVNASAQVLNMDGEVIPGLYGAGEVIGLYYRTYTGSTSVMRGAVFGRVAGLDAAARKNRPT
jgi:tricarballylate dehydrogenase